MNENDIEKILEDFEGEVWLSTDGKHTVRVLAKNTESRAAALNWAKEVYEKIVERYGTKQAQAVKEYAKDNPTSFRGTTAPPAPQNLGNCKDCGAPNKLSMKGKVYCSAKCWIAGA